MIKKAIFVATTLAVSAMSTQAASLREVRAAWLVLGVESAASVAAVERFADANFNTLYLRMESPAGVSWRSTFAPATLSASLASSDVPADIIAVARARSLEVNAIVCPEAEADPEELLAIYREMQLTYGFDGLVLDVSRLGGLSQSERYDFLDRLTLDIIGDFPEMKMTVAVNADRSGESRAEAAALLDAGIVENVVVTAADAVPFGVLSDLWGELPGTVMTFSDSRVADARFQISPWGIAWNAPDASECAFLLSGVFSDYAHVPLRASRPTVPEAPVRVEQQFSGNGYRLNWSAPEWTDDEAPIIYYTVYDHSTGVPVVAKTAGTNIEVPSDNPYRQFDVTAWDVNFGESEPARARVIADEIADELMASPADVEISCLDGHLRLASRALLGNVEIFNLEGLPVMSRRVNRMTASINCSSLAPGVYIVSVKNPDGVACSKKFLLK